MKEKVEISPTCARILGDECRKTIEIADRFGPEAQTQRIRDLTRPEREHAFLEPAS